MPMTIVIEGDDVDMATMLARHMAAFFAEDFPADEACQYWRIPVNVHTCKIDRLEVTKKRSIYNAGVLYRPYVVGSRGDTPYTRLWEQLRDLLPPRLYTMVKEQFALDNKTYSKMKYYASRGATQHEMEF